MWGHHGQHTIRNLDDDMKQRLRWVMSESAPPRSEAVTIRVAANTHLSATPYSYRKLRSRTRSPVPPRAWLDPHVDCHHFFMNFQNNGNMKDNDVVRALAALAQLNRLQVFRTLVVAGRQGATPGQLSESLGVPNATLSFHLKELMNAGLISQERSGRNLIYRVKFARMNGVLAYLTENCCQGAEACLDDMALLERQ